MDDDEIINPSLSGVLQLWYRRRGHGPQGCTLRFDGATGALDVLAFISEQLSESSAPIGQQLSRSRLNQLRELGIIIPRAEAPATATSSLFAEDSVAEAPQLLEHEDHGSQLCLDQDWGPLPDDDPFVEIADLLGIDDSTLRVRPSPAGLALPVNLHPRSLDSLAELRAGRIQPSQLPRPDLEPLIAGGFVTTPAALVARAHYRSTAATRLRDDGLVVLRDLFSPAFSQTLRRYCRAALEQGYLLQDTAEETQRWGQHDNPVLRAVHRALQPLISEVTLRAGHGPCEASYSYLAIYPRAARLSAHVDRPQCRWNLSVALGSSPSVAREESWPIFVAAPGGTARLALGIGDAVLYSGTEHEHWREELEVADSVSVGLFHFVDVGFDGDRG